MTACININRKGGVYDVLRDISSTFYNFEVWQHESIKVNKIFRLGPESGTEKIIKHSLGKI